MATVNTASLRSEFDALKGRFETLCADAHDHVWAKRLGHLLSGTCRRVSELGTKALDEAHCRISSYPIHGPPRLQFADRHPDRTQHRRHNDQAGEGGKQLRWIIDRGRCTSFLPAVLWSRIAVCRGNLGTCTTEVISDQKLPQVPVPVPKPWYLLTLIWGVSISTHS